jgi:hypothetical protein
MKIYHLSKDIISQMILFSNPSTYAHRCLLMRGQTVSFVSRGCFNSLLLLSRVSTHAAYATFINIVITEDWTRKIHFWVVIQDIFIHAVLPVARAYGHKRWTFNERGERVYLFGAPMGTKSDFVAHTKRINLIIKLVLLSIGAWTLIMALYMLRQFLRTSLNLLFVPHVAVFFAMCGVALIGVVAFYIFAYISQRNERLSKQNIWPSGDVALDVMYEPPFTYQRQHGSYFGVKITDKKKKRKKIVENAGLLPSAIP